jgi:hypothetical protein
MKDSKSVRKYHYSNKKVVFLRKQRILLYNVENPCKIFLSAHIGW